MRVYRSVRHTVTGMSLNIFYLKHLELLQLKVHTQCEHTQDP